MGRWIGEKMSRWRTPVSLLIPEGGVSGLDARGGAFFDPEADAALFEAIEKVVVPSGDRAVRRLPLHINAPAFAKALVDEFLRLAGPPPA